MSTDQAIDKIRDRLHLIQSKLNNLYMSIGANIVAGEDVPQFITQAKIYEAQIEELTFALSTLRGEWMRFDNVTADNLTDIMEFDRTITVHEDGSVTESDAYAPSLIDDELSDDSWEFFSAGYTGQYGYNGPIMHNSEMLSGRLAEDILSTPGTYAAVVAEWMPDVESDELYAEGWAIVRLKD